MQLTAELLGQHLLYACPHQPPLGLQDITLLPFVKRALRRDVPGFELRHLVRIKRRLPGCISKL